MGNYPLVLVSYFRKITPHLWQMQQQTEPTSAPITDSEPPPSPLLENGDGIYKRRPLLLPCLITLV